VKRRDLVRHLERHGSELLREGGSHSVYVNRGAKKASSVPRHSEIAGPAAAESSQGCFDGPDALAMGHDEVDLLRAVTPVSWRSPRLRRALARRRGAKGPTCDGCGLAHAPGFTRKMRAPSAGGIVISCHAENLGW